MRRRARNTLAVLFRWHRYVGLTVALLAAVIAVTGAALNHTEALRLDERHVTIQALLDWYGVAPARPPVSFAVGGHRVSQLGERLYVDATPLPGRFGRLVGAVATSNVLVAAVGNQVVLLTPAGEVVERMGPIEGVPAGIGRLGRTAEGRVVADAAHGRYALGASLIQWHRFDGPVEAWGQPSSLPTEQRRSLVAHYRGQALTLERLVLDLHSGRIVGSWGPWAWDAAAAALLFLACTGFVMWWRSRRARRHSGAGKKSSSHY